VGDSMCCEKCTNGGITTDYSKQLLKQLPPEDLWRIPNVCPKVLETENIGKNRIMWGKCRITSDLNTVECCKKCDYFS